MKGQKILFFILIVLLVVPSSTIFAYSNSNSQMLEKSCCCAVPNSSTHGKNCCTPDKDQENNDCGNDCGDNSCHCTSSTAIPLFIESVEFCSSKVYTTAPLGWMYVQSIPKSIAISIWQPPKIG